MGEVTDAAFGIGDAFAEFAVYLAAEAGFGVVGFEFFQTVFFFGEHRVDAFGLLWPAVACLRKVIHGGVVHRVVAVAVGAVGIHIHVAEDEESAAFGLGVAEFENGVAVVEVVAGEEGIQAACVSAGPVDFIFVELLPGGGDGGRFEKLGKLW